MPSTFVRLSKPLDPLAVQTLLAIHRVADSVDVPLLIMGAFARDVWFEHVHGIPAGRATTDIDLGVHVTDWAGFERLRDALLNCGDITPHESRLERLVFRAEQYFDLIPFGGVAEENDSIRWPEDGAVMSVVGFEEASSSAAALRLDDARQSAELKLVTVPNLVVLKLVAWNDRPKERARDVRDIGFILENYLDAGNRERVVFGDATDLLDTEPYDEWIVAARLLGRDINQALKPKTRCAVAQILGREVGSHSHCPLSQGLRKFVQGDFCRARQAVEALHAGLLESGR